jgi:hypothetical protein
MRSLMAFGDRNAARHPDSQTAEVQIRVTLISRFNAPGATETVHMASNQWKKGKPRPKPEFRKRQLSDEIYQMNASSPMCDSAMLIRLSVEYC